MRVVVTGATSLIGRATVEHLARRGDAVVCLQRRRSTTPWPDGVAEHCGDVTSRSDVAMAMSDAEVVVHLAARVGVVGTRAEFERVNVDGTATVIAAARRSGARGVVHVSSPSVAHRGEPLVGAAAEPATTGHGRAWYPETKAIAERAALAASSGRLGVVAVRPHLVWGPGDEQLVGRIVERARRGRLALVGGGTALIDATFVDNAADALVAAVDAIAPGARCAGKPYVVSDGTPRPVAELIRGICGAAGVPFAPRDVPFRVARPTGSVMERLWSFVRRGDEPPLTRFVAEQLGTAHWFDPRPAREDLGWRPQVPIEEGFARLADWFARAGGPST